MTNPSDDQGNLHSSEAHQADCDAILESCLERLATLGPVDDPNQLRQMLPVADATLRRFVLLELIKLDMALRAEAGSDLSLEPYLCRFADLISSDSVPVDLVLEEIQLRKESGLEPTRESYRRRFPQFALLIGNLIGESEGSAGARRGGKPAELDMGSEIDDFAILQKLGEGAFAHVYLARQLSMQRLVALKVSAGEGSEPQALAQFDHPNIVRVFDRRTLPEPPVTLLYMQYHPGGTLADVVPAVRGSHVASVRGKILLQVVDQNLLRAAQVVPDRSSVRQWIESAHWPMVVAWLGVQLANALQEAHRLDMLHRDVKPANVLLTAEGIPKLADFNVSDVAAAVRGDSADSLGGSIGYMSPEHLRAISAAAIESTSPVGKEADLYSLAILLWELWQGHRPFPTVSTQSWNELVVQQLGSRSEPLLEPTRVGSASERVLELTLRAALQSDVTQRPRAASEMAGRLKLALHPEAAALLDPADDTHRGWTACRSPWICAGIVILIPNVAAGLLNFAYNSREIKMTDEMRQTLLHLATWVNAFVYPLGVLLMIIFAKALANAVKSARMGQPVKPDELGQSLELGHRAAIIGGTCWIVAGMVYTVILSSMYADFTAVQASHFFVSMVICGGVAMVYPMFGMALLITFIYYPMLVRGTMQDQEFDQRRSTMVRRCQAYLLVAGIIPLLGTALLISSESSSIAFMLISIAAGVVGFVASFFAYLSISDAWSRFAEVLSSKSHVVPAEAK